MACYTVVLGAVHVETIAAGGRYKRRRQCVVVSWASELPVRLALTSQQVAEARRGLVVSDAETTQLGSSFIARAAEGKRRGSFLALLRCGAEA